MNVMEAIRARRSIRKYQKGAVIPKEHICLILEAAMMAPSACNTRPWEFVVVQDEQLKKEIVEYHPFAKHLLDASLGIVVCGLPEKQTSYGEGYWPQDCGAAIENMLLAAWELGYGTCWCGIYPRLERAKVMQKLLGVDSVPLAVVTLGVPAEVPAARGFYEESKVKFL